MIKRFIPEIFKSKIKDEIHHFKTHDDLMNLDFVRTMKQHNREPDKKDEHFKRFVLKNNDLMVELKNNTLIPVGVIDNIENLRLVKI